MGKAPSDSPKASLDTLTERLARLSALGWQVTTGPETDPGTSTSDADTSGILEDRER